MYMKKNAIAIEGGHLACLIFLPDKPVGEGGPDILGVGEEFQKVDNPNPVILSGSEESHPEGTTKINNPGAENFPCRCQEDDSSLHKSVPLMKAVVIACHGFRGGKENGGRINSLAEKLTANGFGLLAFDFRGTGESSGEFVNMTIAGQAADLKQIINWAEYTYRVPIIVLGRSLGGSTVLACLQSDNRPSAAVLWSTPINVSGTFKAIMGPLADDMAAGKVVTITDEYSTYQLGPGFWQDLSNHDFIGYLNQVGKIPMLVIHGEADEIVAVDNANAIKEAVPSAQLITVPGADHKFINGWELRENFTVAWLNSLFS